MRCASMARWPLPGSKPTNSFFPPNLSGSLRPFTVSTDALYSPLPPDPIENRDEWIFCACACVFPRSLYSISDRSNWSVVAAAAVICQQLMLLHYNRGLYVRI